MPDMQDHRPQRFLVGRADVLEDLRRSVRDDRPQVPPLVLLEGDEGVGKTVMVQTLLPELGEGSSVVLTARAIPSEIPQPFSLVQELLRSTPLAPPERPVAEELSAGLAGAGLPTEPTDREMLPLGLLALDSQEEDPRDRAVRLLDALTEGEESWAEGRRSMFDRVERHLEDLAHGSPLRLVVEDLQNVDMPSWEFLEFFLRGGRAASRKVLATIRPASQQPRALRARLEELQRAGQLRRILARPLTEGETREFLGTLVPGHALSEETLTEWHTRSRGNPLFLEQLFRMDLVAGARAAGISSGADGRSLPTQMAILDADERKLLAYASVIGSEFPFPLLVSASGLDEEWVAERLEDFVRRGWLRDKGRETYAFSPESARAAVYRSLTDTRRRILHRKVAEALEKLPGAPEPPLFDLANHFYLAQVPEKAFEYNRRAAARAEGTHAPEARVQHLERALEALQRAHPEDGAGLRRLRTELALAYETAGDSLKAESLLRSLLPSAPGAPTDTPAEELGMLWVTLARLLGRMSRWNEVPPLLTEARRWVDPEKDPFLAGQIAILEAEVDDARNRIPAAREHYLEAAGWFQRARAAAHAVRARLHVADMDARTAGRLGPDAERIYREGIAELRRLDDRRELAFALNNYAYWKQVEGDLERTVELLTQGLQVAKDSGDLRRVGWLHFNLADALLHLGRPEEAKGYNAEARREMEKVADQVGRIHVRLNEGRIEMASGAWTAAEIALLDAYRMAREGGYEMEELEVLFHLARWSLARGDAATARTRRDELRQRGFVSLHPEFRVAFGQLDRELGSGSPPGTPPPGGA